MLKGDVHIRYAEAFVSCLRGGFIDASMKTVSSQPQLSGVVLDEFCGAAC